MAATHIDDPKVLAEVSEQMTGAMKGLAVAPSKRKICCRRGDGRDSRQPPAVS